MNLNKMVIEISDNIKKMAELLRSGNTMLNIPCPICNNPIFRKRDGNTFCPTCNRNVLIISNKTLQNNIAKGNEIQNNTKQEIASQNRKNEVFNLLEDVLIEKIEMISEKLRNEVQLNLIEKYTNILVKYFDILRYFSSRRERN
ncbi:MAG: Sjogren's syndrome/scleroderma autoantigen 1 family protein [Candidatus Hodarchaeota archaeon]